MALTQQLNLTQKQRLSMTPRLQQAIRVLQLNQTDLLALLEEEVQKNPLLELEPAQQSAKIDPPVASVATNEFSAVDMLAAQVSQIDKLHDQIALITAPERLKSVALLLSGELDESGYLTTPLFELADRLGTRTEEIELALVLVQACEPVGIGARNLRECLTLQLKARNRFDPVIGVVLDNLDLVAMADLRELSRLTGECENAVEEMIAEIRLLNPRPATSLNTFPIGEIVPDVEVKRGAMGELKVELVAESLPRVLVNNSYAAEISAQGGEATKFARNYLDAANWLVQALDQRATTILKAATAIVQHQYAFFDDGPIAMQPLTLREIAESIGMHESTVSRVTNGKFLTCCRGTFEMKYFFSARIPALNENSAFSALGIRTRIKRLIEQESHKKTLSDDAIVNILREDGADVARRTIAKYREAMGIPSSVRRRRLYDNQNRHTGS